MRSPLQDTQKRRYKKWGDGSELLSRYIREELHCFSEGMTKNMKRNFKFVNVSGGAYQDVTDQCLESDYNINSAAAAQVFHRKRSILCAPTLNDTGICPQDTWLNWKGAPTWRWYIIGFSYCGGQFVQGMDSPNARLTQASAGVHPPSGWVWYQTTP